MKLCKKWVDLGWKETDRFFSETYTRTYNDKTQIVCQTPSRTMWRAIQYDKNNVPISDILFPTMSKALSYSELPLDTTK